MIPPPEPTSEFKPSSKGGSSALRSGRSSRSSTIARKAEKFISPRGPAPIPIYDFDSAPAPHIGHEKPKDVQPSTTNNTTKESKPGFFRGMFGSAKSVVPEQCLDPSAILPIIARQEFHTSIPRGRGLGRSYTANENVFIFPDKETLCHRDRLPLLLYPLYHLSSFRSTNQSPAQWRVIGGLRTRSWRVALEPRPLRRLSTRHCPLLRTHLTQCNISIEQTTPRRPTDARARRPTRAFSPDYDPSPKAVIHKVDSEPPNG